MTVCIAAICNGGQAGGEAIVTASDRKISTGSYSADSVAIKVSGFKNDWGALWASNDVTETPSILYEVEARCKSQGTGYKEMADLFVQVIEEKLRERARRVLAPFDLTIEDFLKNGKAMFSEEQHQQIFESLRSERAQTQFLVFGFDKAEQPHIFTVSDDGSGPLVAFYDQIGFAAIGSGTDVASSSMYFYGYQRYKDMERTAYLVCQGKFMAETAEGVGRDTFAFVHRPRQNSFPLMPDKMKQMRDYWEKKGKPKIPKDALAETKRILDSAEEWARNYEARRECKEEQ